MAISKDVYDKEVIVSPMEELPQEDDLTPPFDPSEVELSILLKALTRFFFPQILKLNGYINHRKFIILVHSGNTHYFIHCHISQDSRNQLLYLCSQQFSIHDF
jgi:hypothetical protein